MRTQNKQIITNGDLSGNVTAPAILLENIYGYSVQAVLTGSPVGSIKLQASDDEGTDLIGGGVTNWTDITESITAVTTSGNIIWNVTSSFYRWARVVYVFTSGSGTLNARFNIKGL